MATIIKLHPSPVGWPGHVAQKYRIMTPSLCVASYVSAESVLLCPPPPPNTHTHTHAHTILFPLYLRENMRKSREVEQSDKPLVRLDLPSSAIFFDAEVIRGSPVSMVMALATLQSCFPRLSESPQVIEKSMSNLQSCLRGTGVWKGSVPWARVGPVGWEPWAC